MPSIAVLFCPTTPIGTDSWRPSVRPARNASSPHTAIRIPSSAGCAKMAGRRKRWRRNSGVNPWRKTKFPRPPDETLYAAFHGVGSNESDQRESRCAGGLFFRGGTGLGRMGPVLFVRAKIEAPRGEQFAPWLGHGRIRSARLAG